MNKANYTGVITNYIIYGALVSAEGYSISVWWKGSGTIRSESLFIRNWAPALV